MDDTLNVAIYSRKSRFTGKGDSIENQVELCKQYIYRNYASKKTNIMIYEDEGFSGKNTARPQFQNLMKDIKSKKVDILICYKLDRISRSVSDFSTTYEILEKQNVSFISISENFDTSTPIGKSMLYISSVFSQLERETIAERVRDNMYELAKSGQWLGGRPPIGFDSIRKTYVDENGRQRRYSMLTGNKQEQEFVMKIINKYLELRSLRQLQKYSMQNEWKGKQGGLLETSTLSDILRSVYGVEANTEVYEYLSKNGYKVFKIPDETHGLLLYSQDSEKIISVGKHEGFIDPNLWLEVQRLLDFNISKAPNLEKTHRALLTGVLKCKCNYGMRVAHGGGENKNNFYYICALKIASSGSRCKCKNLNGPKTEKIIIDRIKSLNKETILEELKNYEHEIKQNIENNNKRITELKKNISSKENALNKLISRLSLVDDSLIDDVITQMNIIKIDTKDLKQELLELEELQNENSTIELNREVLTQSIKNFNNLIDSDDITIDLRRTLIKQIIKRITWDYENEILKIDYFFEDKKKL